MLNFRVALYQIWYKVRNWRASWRAFYYSAGFHGAVAFASRLNAILIRADGTRIDLGCIGRRMVTTAGVNYLRDTFAAHASGNDVQNFKWHASGTGVGGEAIGDTVLGTEVTDNARTAGTQDNSVAKTYTTVNTITYTGAHAITEHGIFSAVSSGTLWDRTVFGVITVANTDQIQFTYTLTINDGG